MSFKRTCFMTAALCALLLSAPAQAGKYGYFNDDTDEQEQTVQYRNPGYSGQYRNHDSMYNQLQREQDSLYRQQQQLHREQESDYCQFNRSHQYLKGGKHY